MSRRPLVAWCVAAPGVVLAAVGAWGALTNAGGALLWPPDRVTLPEAVALANYAEVSAQIERGTDPNLAADVRPLLVSPGSHHLTPLQTAVRERNPRMLRLLLDYGALVGPSGLAVLRCLNEEHPDEQVRTTLDTLGPPGTASCGEIPLPR